MENNIFGIIMIELKRFKNIDWVEMFLDEHNIKIDAYFLMTKKEQGYTKLFLDAKNRRKILGYSKDSTGNAVFINDSLMEDLHSLEPLRPTKKYNINSEENELILTTLEDNFIKQIESGEFSDEEILNIILEKIGKSGVESLTQYEKELLNKYS